MASWLADGPSLTVPEQLPAKPISLIRPIRSRGLYGVPQDLLAPLQRHLHL